MSRTWADKTETKARVKETNETKRNRQPRDHFRKKSEFTRQKTLDILCGKNSKFTRTKIWEMHKKWKILRSWSHKKIHKWTRNKNVFLINHITSTSNLCPATSLFSVLQMLINQSFQCIQRPGADDKTLKSSFKKFCKIWSDEVIHCSQNTHFTAVAQKMSSELNY